MTSISEIRQEIFQSKIHVLQIRSDGTVQESENTIFSIPIGAHISELHPFFEGIQPLLPDLDSTIHFPCVFLEIDAISIIADIDLIKENDLYFVVIFDFTEHYQQSHPLVQEKNEAFILKHKLAFERDLLLAKEEFKNKFLTHLNHEIRNPLNSMFGFMEILENSKLSYEQKEALNVMHKTGTHLKVLMDDLLDISKIEQGALVLKHVNFGFNDLISSLTKHFELKYNKKKISLYVDLDKHIPARLVGDPSRLNQILFNLLENAFRNTEVGSITLKVISKKHPDDINKTKLEFHITDTGKGISEENIPYIFESYYQIGLNELKPLGQGLGLKIVKDLVGLLKGTVEVSSEVDKGSSFHLSIPFEVPPKKDPGKRKTVPKGSGIVLSKRVLIIEDNEIDQMLFMKGFVDEGKYAIEIAKNGPQGLQMLEKRNYTLVILKTGLPEMDGFEITRRIRGHKDPAIAQVPVLVVSGNVMLEQQQRILDAGASTFLAKPYTNRELFKKIESLLK